MPSTVPDIWTPLLPIRGMNESSHGWVQHCPCPRGSCSLGLECIAPKRRMEVHSHAIGAGLAPRLARGWDVPDHPGEGAFQASPRDSGHSGGAQLGQPRRRQVGEQGGVSVWDRQASPFPELSSDRGRWLLHLFLLPFPAFWHQALLGKGGWTHGEREEGIHQASKQFLKLKFMLAKQFGPF